MRRNSQKFPKKNYRNYTTQSQSNIDKEWIALQLLKPIILIISADELVLKVEVIPIHQTQATLPVMAICNDKKILNT